MTSPEQDKGEEQVDNRPNSQKDLERRMAADFSPKKLADEARDKELKDGTIVSYAVEGNDTSGYIGVSPEYATYANETEAPLRATEGVEAEATEALTQPLRQAKVKPSYEGKQITGVGSTNPVIYSEVSGEDYKTEVVTVKGGKEPKTVEDVEKLSASDRPAEEALVPPAPKAPKAPASGATEQ